MSAESLFCCVVQSEDGMMEGEDVRMEVEVEKIADHVSGSSQSKERSFLLLFYSELCTSVVLFSDLHVCVCVCVGVFIRSAKRRTEKEGRAGITMETT